MCAQSIQRLLVANRGEIAVRILQAARELSPSIETFALYTDDDRSHCDIGRPHHAVRVPSAAAYLDIPLLVNLSREHQIDFVHPGYGFLSESAEFASRLHDAGVTVIGPGPEILICTGDKLKAKQLAIQCEVPVLPAMSSPTSDLVEIHTFARQVGYPIMIKAVDGGGGRGIRLVRQEAELEHAVRAATNESPSQTVFVEKAAVDGFHHLEVQIVGDGIDVCHLWERDCSLQRRFQKVVEFAPSLMQSRDVVEQVVNAALRMAKEIRYRSLGTVEFLVHEHRREFYFLEINPRLQVEHTITENITSVDLVQTQLQLAMGLSLAQVGLLKDHPVQPRGHSIQLRLCAEDPSRDFHLSIGKITEFVVPSGNGVRIDTHVDTSGSSPVTVGANFDNMLAKIIVTASSWEATVSKARRVLTDTKISGVQTNLNLLRGILSHDNLLTGQIDTQWLERHLAQVISFGETIAQSIRHEASAQPSRSLMMPSSSSSNLLFRPGDAWSITLKPLGTVEQRQHHLQLTRVLQNDFPTSMAAEVKYTTPSSSMAYQLQLKNTSTTASALVSSSHRRGDVHNPRHIVLPLSGKLIEVLVAAGDQVVENQVVAFVKQMKMELEVRSPRGGRVQWVYQMDEEEEDVAEGMLLVELEEEVRGKL
ncbi:carbamoyl-phosphate synthase L chain, ATP binding domain-containing protein [Aspergillus pseudonomiae]|uniref:Carbamoyl-phosphate synthase L chain, ATP binding domain-containing protein n=1 Tax=Aspergillus pseudonomiae TaxID=1506151 RepID=A0A5N7DKW4_9EURO|nr:carbamoyl-phosphate synthase L chain, ATP binding domain-containing protein [Aspergillus pseudonomiae]KAB8262376.1 carbamoyl-phosphate synthase L chain, ATP binding domain-containing protein [Aspergillus pseudonomiae]KAE8407014.1 carbamoyl-phosphate synthase L chain, ATP binding domain-containing protein [Aspergillus pseudonomiae]